MLMGGIVIIVSLTIIRVNGVLIAMNDSGNSDRKPNCLLNSNGDRKPKYVLKGYGDRNSLDLSLVLNAVGLTFSSSMTLLSLLALAFSLV